MSRKDGEKQLDWMEQVGSDHIQNVLLPKIHSGSGLQRANRLKLLKVMSKFVRDDEKQRKHLSAILKPKKKKRSDKVAESDTATRPENKKSSRKHADAES